MPPDAPDSGAMGLFHRFGELGAETSGVKHETLTQNPYGEEQDQNDPNPEWQAGNATGRFFGRLGLGQLSLASPAYNLVVRIPSSAVGTIRHDLVSFAPQR